MKPMLVLATVAALACAASAWAGDGGVAAGTLTCKVSSGWGFVFGSSKDLDCTYNNGSGHVDKYIGTINKYGVDIGYQQGGVMIWAVFAPANDVSPGAIAGNYVGVTAGASVGIGAHSNALVGGSANSVSLQPLSIGGAAGLNVAAGLASISLAYVPD
jgi:hypothetical protein